MWSHTGFLFSFSMVRDFRTGIDMLLVLRTSSMCKFTSLKVVRKVLWFARTGETLLWKSKICNGHLLPRGVRHNTLAFPDKQYEYMGFHDRRLLSNSQNQCLRSLVERHTLGEILALLFCKSGKKPRAERPLTRLRGTRTRAAAALTATISDSMTKGGAHFVHAIV